MDLDLKRDAEELFGSLGMNLTTAFNIFVRQSLQVQGLPFPVKLKLHADAGIDKDTPKTEEQDTEE